MKTIKHLGLVIIFLITLQSYSQTAEEIVDTYIENIGGQEAWSKINSMRIKGNAKQQGIDYAFVATFMKDGRTLIDVDLQGSSFIVEAFDGETFWAMNFQTRKAEAADSEASKNYKIDAKDNVPDALVNYKEKGYSVELLGNESFDGTNCFKIKLTKTPLLVEGKQEDNVVFYYFDAESFVPIAQESTVKSGPGKGMIVQELISDYQEVDGLYIAFSNEQKFDGNTGLVMNITSVEFNVEIDESIFKMPEEETVITKD